jgi:hypothetical protein
MLETNMDIALGYGQYVQSNNADVIDDFPAWELFRAEDRFRPRGDPEYKGDAAIGWESRWEQAGAAAGDDDALRMLNEFSRMVALKSSAIWNHLGDDWQDSLGNPFPPFAWGSGMDTEEISRSEGEALGLLESGDTVEPRDIPDLNDTLEAPIETRDQQLLDALLKSLPDDTELKNGILTLKGEGGMLFNNERDSIRASSADFDESLHPRVPAGSPEGGEFTSGGENAHGFTDNGDQTATLRGHTVVRETEKALLLRTKTGSEAWVPKSQMTVEGDKVNMPHWVASKFQPTLHVFKPEFPVGETDKAWKLRVSVERMDGEPETATVFLPKSQVSRTADGALKAPRWLLDAKEAEISDRSTGRTGLLW